MSLIDITITSDGKAVPQAFGLLYINTSNEFNKIPYAEFAFIDGDQPLEEYNITDSGLFEPGREIEIRLRYSDPASEKMILAVLW